MSGGWRVTDDGDTNWQPGGPPEAVIERLGRWRHLAYIRRDLMRYGPSGDGWTVFGAKRAERKARKVLAAYLRRQAPRETKVIR